MTFGNYEALNRSPSQEFSDDVMRALTVLAHGGESTYFSADFEYCALIVRAQASKPERLGEVIYYREQT